MSYDLIDILLALLIIAGVVALVALAKLLFNLSKTVGVIADTVESNRKSLDETFEDLRHLGRQSSKRGFAKVLYIAQIVFIFITFVLLLAEIISLALSSQLNNQTVQFLTFPMLLGTICTFFVQVGVFSVYHLVYKLYME